MKIYVVITDFREDGLFVEAAYSNRKRAVVLATKAYFSPSNRNHCYNELVEVYDTKTGDNEETIDIEELVKNGRFGSSTKTRARDFSIVAQILQEQKKEEKQ